MQTLAHAGYRKNSQQIGGLQRHFLPQDPSGGQLLWRMPWWHMAVAPGCGMPVADNARMTDTLSEIAQAAARLVVDEGLEYAAAKRRALKM